MLKHLLSVRQLLGQTDALCSLDWRAPISPVMQLFEYILEYLRTVRFGEADHSLALPAEQTELAQIVREVSTLMLCLYKVSPFVLCMHASSAMRMGNNSAFRPCSNLISGLPARTGWGNPCCRQEA